MKNSVLIDSNSEKINRIANVIMHTVDRVVNTDTNGLLTRPKTGPELTEFKETVVEVVTNKIRNKLGV